MGAIAITIQYSPPYLTEIVIHCQNIFLAQQISDRYNILIYAIKQLQIATVSIFLSRQLFRGFMNDPLMDSVRQEMMESQGRQVEENRRFMETLNRHEINMNSWFHSPHPHYVTAMHNGILVYANNAALKANQKTIDQLVGENLATLHFPEELEKINQFLRKDGKLTNYEFKAMNWYQDGKWWRRKKMNFVADFKVIEFGETICRLGIDLAVEETNQFVD